MTILLRLLGALIAYHALHRHSTLLVAAQETNEDSCDAPLPEPDDMGIIDIGYGVPQVVSEEGARDRLKETRNYMQKLQDDGTLRPELVAECKNENPDCTYWASVGECVNNPGYMETSCAPACFTCNLLDIEHRCAFDDAIREDRIWPAGGGSQMFTKIVTEWPHAQVLSSDPYVIVIDDFLTADECQHLIDLGAARGYEPSKGVGARKADGTFEESKTESRTSSNAWCMEDCYENKDILDVIEKLENLTGIPDSHHEYLQLLHYEVGQYYRSHHDYIDYHNQRSMGVRILTVFLYLNDVEEGGATRFTNLNLTVTAKRGRALLWPSVLDDRPDEIDGRTYHEAMPVLAGKKYGANAWMHQRDFKEAFARSCI